MRHQSGSVTTKFQISKGDLFADENSVPVFSIVEVTTYAQLIQPLPPVIFNLLFLVIRRVRATRRNSPRN